MTGIVSFLNSISHDIIKISDGREVDDVINKRVQSVALRVLGLATMFLGVITGFAALGSFLSLSAQFIPLSIYSGACTVISHDTLTIGNNLSNEIGYEIMKITCTKDVCRRVLRKIEHIKENCGSMPAIFKNTWFLEPSYKLLDELNRDNLTIK